MFTIILSGLLQVTATTATPAVPPVPERFSILVDPCATQTQDGTEIIVCGKSATTTPRLPMRDDRGPPDHAAASNPNLSAVRALDICRIHRVRRDRADARSASARRSPRSRKPR